MFEFLFVSMLQTAAGAPLIEPAAPAEVMIEDAIPESVLRRRDRQLLRCRDRAIPGTRIGNRVCMSNADLSRQREDTRAMTDTMHRSAFNTPFMPDTCRGGAC